MPLLGQEAEVATPSEAKPKDDQPAFKRTHAATIVAIMLAEEDYLNDIDHRYPKSQKSLHALVTLTHDMLFTREMFVNRMAETRRVFELFREQSIIIEEEERFRSVFLNYLLFMGSDLIVPKDAHWGIAQSSRYRVKAVVFLFSTVAEDFFKSNFDRWLTGKCGRWSCRGSCCAPSS